jgi:outer membrane protein
MLRVRSAALIAALLLAAATPAAALTLQEAVASAYATNPTIAAQRALVRQVDEGVPIARAAARPTLGPSVGFTQNFRDGFVDDGRLISAGLTLGQPIWLGGRMRANVEGAEQRIESARARLVAVENNIIVATVAAYADVLRAASIVRLNENQVRVLERQLQASQDRFEVGDLTRTDVAQSEARLEAARSNLIAARTREVEAQQLFRRLTGLEAVDLAPLPPLPALPRNLGEAREAAFMRNPDLQASRTDEAAAKADVKAIAGERLGTVGLQVSGAYQDFRLGQGTIGGTISGFGGDIRVTASMPLLTGGLLAARTRQAQARQSQLLETIAATERLVDEVVTERFAALRNAEATIVSAESAIRANALAVEGVRQENLVGSRDIIDVLNAEQELLNAEIIKENAERERYVAAYNLLEITGDVSALLSLVPVERWDPEANARRVRRMGEFAVDPDPREDRQRNSLPLPDTLTRPRN